MEIANADQADADNDGIGDACEVDPGLCDYVLFAKEEIKIKKSTIHSGGVGVYDDDDDGVEVEEDGHIDNVTESFVIAEEIEIDNDGSVLAPKTYENAPEDLLDEIPFQYANPGNTDLTVPTNSTATAYGATFDKIEVKKDATLVFSGQGEIDIEELKVEEGATIKFNQTTTVRIEKDLELKKNSTFNSTGEVVIVFLEKDLKVKEGCDVTGTFYSKEEIETDGKSNNHIAMTGLFIADKIESKYYTDWYSGTCGVGNQNGNFQRLIANDKVSADDINPNPDVSAETKPFTFLPNPASTYIRVQTNRFEGQSAVIRIVNEWGTTVWQTREHQLQDELQIEVYQIPAGFYWLEIQASGHRQIEKVVITR